MISVVSPFYNESLVLRESVENMCAYLNHSGYDYELIIVNDGSTDDSKDLAEELVKEHFDNIKLVSYPINKGRGYALRKGIESAQGDVIVTTEIDGSWGKDMVTKLVEHLERNPKLDMVIASPHLYGGGFRNVPFKRRLLSTLGNKLIRAAFYLPLTMFTGMTRAYRKDVIKALPLWQTGKEFHLEVLAKMLALDFQIGEIPAVLEWKDSGKSKPTQQKRKSSTRILQVMLSHLLFVVGANPVRYLWPVSLMCLIPAIYLFGLALHNFFIGEAAFYYGVGAGGLFLVSLLLFIFGVLANQNSQIQRDIWRVQRQIILSSNNDKINRQSYR